MNNENETFGNAFSDKKPADITPPKQVQTPVKTTAAPKTDLIEEPIPQEPASPAAIRTQNNVPQGQKQEIKEDKPPVKVEQASAPAVIPTNELAEYCFDNGIGIGMENMETQDILTPELKIVQKTHDTILESFSDSLGKIYNSFKNEITDFVDVVVIYFAKSRSYFDKSNRTGPRLCFSLDSKRPNGSAFFKPEDNMHCAMCPHLKERDENNKDLCTFIAEYTLILADTLKSGSIVPYRFSCSGGALPEARNFNSTLKGIKVPFFHVFRISTKKKQWSGTNTSYIPVFDYLRHATEEERQLYKELSLKAAQSYKATLAQAESTWEGN